MRPLLIGFLFFTTGTLIAKPLSLANIEETIPLGDYVEYYEDITTNLSLEEMLHKSEWKKPPNRSLGFATSRSAFWFKLSIKDDARNGNWIIEVPYALLDRVDVFYTNESGDKFETVSSGRERPFENRSLESKNVNAVFPTGFSTGTIYVRIQSESSLLCGMNLWRKDAFLIKDARENIFYGIYFGALLIMAFYNLLIYFSIRDPNYLRYVLYVLSFCAFQFWLSGFVFQYALRAHPLTYKSTQPAVMCLTVFLVVLFSYKFLRLSAHAPRLARLLLLTTIVQGLIGVYGAFNYSLFSRLAPTLVMIALSLLLIGAVLALRQGYRPAKYYVAAFGGLLLAAILWTLSRTGIVPSSVAIEAALPIGSLFEILMLSLALGDRINLMKQEKEETQRLSLDRQKTLTESYARFVPSEIMGLLNKQEITQVSLGDAVQREMTVLFSDIRSFTTLSETMTPQENFQFLNALMRRTGPVIRTNGGFIDKYIGDSIMALFPGHPENALKAGIQMKLNLRLYNERRREQNFQPLKVGIGINTGMVMLGTIGEPGRMDGTVISDTVNLASRIEGLTKYYDAALLVTEQTLFRLSDPTVYKFRMLDRVQVKGKNEPVSIFEIFDGDADSTVHLKALTQSTFEHAVQAHLNRDFDEAMKLFKQILETNPEDGAAQLYLQRSEYYSKHGVPIDWQGISVMNEK